MIQVKPFVIANAGTKKYWCLLNVRKGYGVAPYYEYALLDWRYNVQQHKNRSFPSGCAVPVYFNWRGTVGGVYKNWGHIAVRLANGKVWSDGQYFTSVDDLVNRYLSNGSYLGWGESVNKVRVIKQEVTNVAETVSNDVGRQWEFHILGRDGYDGRRNSLVNPKNDLQGRPMTTATANGVFLSAEAENHRHKVLPAVYAERDALRVATKNQASEIERLSKAVEDLNSTIIQQRAVIIGLNNTLDEKKGEIDELADENAKLRKQLEDCGTTPDPDSVVITKDSLWTTFTKWVDKIRGN